MLSIHGIAGLWGVMKNRWRQYIFLIDKYVGPICLEKMYYLGKKRNKIFAAKEGIQIILDCVTDIKTQ